MELLGVNINLKKKDVSFLAALFVFMVATANLVAIFGSAEMIQLIIVPVTLLNTTAGIYFTVKAKSQWGGKMGRFLDFQAIAMMLLTYMWILTYVVNNKIYLLGINPGYWTTYMYTAGASGFIIAVYSFYLLDPDNLI